MLGQQDVIRETDDHEVADGRRDACVVCARRALIALADDSEARIALLVGCGSQQRIVSRAVVRPPRIPNR